MGKHSKDGKPTAGLANSPKGGQKPKRGQVTQRTSSGTVLWKATASLFSKKGKK